MTVLVFLNQRLVELSSPAEIRLVDESNVADALSMEPPERIEQFRAHLARGDRGYYAYLDGKVVSRMWAQRGPVVGRLWSSWGAAPVGPHGVYLHSGETAPSARGLGIYPAILARAAADARQAGITQILGFSAIENIGSQRGLAKAGYVEDYRVELVIRFGIGRQRRLPAPPGQVGAK